MGNEELSAEDKFLIFEQMNLHQRHSVGALVIDGAGDRATAGWHWIVQWREGATGIASTGTYNDVFERRNGQWKCLERVSSVDANWPIEMFKEWADREQETFRAS